MTPIRPFYAASATDGREQMDLIRLSFVLGAGWGSRLIAWYGQGWGGWSHVDAVLPEGYLGARSDEIGGQPPGVQLRPPHYEQWVRQEIMALAVPRAKRMAWEKHLRAQVGFEYDARSIVAFVLGLKTQDHPGYWICSACQTDALQDPAVDLLPKYPIPPAQVTPDTLYLAAWTAGFRPIYNGALA